MRISDWSSDVCSSDLLAVLGFDEDEPTVTGGSSGGGGDEYGVVGIFLRLLDLPDRVVMEVIAIVMGETLASGSAAVEAVGLHIGVAMEDYWHADDAFFALLRDKIGSASCRESGCQYW